MNDPMIDKIIGCSAINRNSISAMYKTGAVAFSAHGFFSIVLPKEKQRFDMMVADNCREITALAFSNTGQHLVIGELGPNARFFVVTFSEKYDKILTKTEVHTKENGFSCLAMNSDSGIVITVGNDQQPFLLLWDMTQARPACIGYYHLPTKPTNIAFANDCSFAFVSGNQMLKFLDTGISYSTKPVPLKCRNANIGQFKNSNFVSAAISVEAPFTAYGLTNDATICVFDNASIPYKNTKGPRKTAPIVIVPIRLKCGETTSLVLDKKIILCGTASGSVLAIKKEGNQHKVFGQFSSEGNAVIGIAISERLTAAAHDDGSVLFWQRRINSQPMLSLSSHRGPICGLYVLPDCILSCGSDATVRSWKLQRNQELISKSSQEQISSRVITKLATDYKTTLTGVRCVASKDNLVFAGDNSGNLHLMKLEGLSEIKKVIENFPGVICMAVHPKEPLLATGGGDGSIRLYKIQNQNISMINPRSLHSSPVTSIVFAQEGIITASSDGLRFCKLPSCDIYASHDSDEAILSLATIPNGKIVIAGSCDNSIYLYRVRDGSLFRRHKLSQSSYPLAIATDKSGLFIAVAMSDGYCSLLDLFSGDTIYSFNSMAGIITNIQFHEGDILLSSFSGCIMRWAMPSAVHKAIAEKNTQTPIFDLLLNSGPTTVEQPNQIPGSQMKCPAPSSNWVFKEIIDNQIQLEKPQAQDVSEEEDVADQAGFDAPRPSVEGEYESRVDDLVRQSFIRRQKQALEEQNSPRSISKSSSGSGICEELVLPPKRAPSGLKKTKPIPKMEQLQFDQDDTDPFIAPGKDQIPQPPIPKFQHTPPPPQQPQNKSRAEEMKEVAQNLFATYERSKEFLSVKTDSSDELASQRMISDTLEMIRKDMMKGSQLPQKIRDLAQMIVSTANQLE